MLEAIPINVSSKAIQKNIQWELVEVSAAEIRDFLYLNHEEWLQRTNGSRRVRDAIRLLPQNRFVEKGIRGILKKLSLPEPLPPIIVLSTTKNAKKRMILEGHFRATAMGMMRGNRKFSILFGVSSEVKGMKYW